MTTYGYRAFGSLSREPDSVIDGVDISDEVRWSLRGTVEAMSLDEATDKVSDQIDEWSFTLDMEGIDVTPIESS